MNCLLDILNNATIAGIIVISISSLIGSRIYRKQKEIDREYLIKEKINESLYLLIEHCKLINTTIDRLANSLNVVIKDNNNDSKERFINILPLETEKLSQMLMLQIPQDKAKIESILSLYFTSKNTISIAKQGIFEELKKWHDFVQIHISDKNNSTYPLNTRVSMIDELSTKNLENKIEILINLLSK